jgi:hypothetical protein
MQTRLGLFPGEGFMGAPITLSASAALNKEQALKSSGWVAAAEAAALEEAAGAAGLLFEAAG